MNQARTVWLPRIGWIVVLIAFVVFVWGLQRRAKLEATGEEVIRMLFVPSVEQGTLVQRGDELARFIREDSGLTLRTEVPTSYAAVIQALGAGQADVAWMPAFAYVLARAKYGADAKLQVVRSAEHFTIVVAREGEQEPASLEDLAGERIALPQDLGADLEDKLRQVLGDRAPGWIEEPVADDKSAIQALLDRPLEIAAAASSHVLSGPHDFVGDGRKELEYDRPGTMLSTRILFTSDEPVARHKRTYHGCIYARTDSSARRLEDFSGQRFAFSDETSTSGHLFPRLVLQRAGIALGRVYFAGGHPNVVQAVWDGKALGGSAFYSPPNKQQREEGLYVGDARYIVLRRMEDDATRRQFLDEVRVIALTDPIPNDLCAVRQGFSPQIWDRFYASLQRFLDTENGKSALFDLLAAVTVAPTTDSDFDGFREALQVAGISAENLLEAEERKLEARREKEAEAK
jgi:ABC-type phosphate/phosphonate transport system substrate-binding protein